MEIQLQDVEAKLYRRLQVSSLDFDFAQYCVGVYPEEGVALSTVGEARDHLSTTIRFYVGFRYCICATVHKEPWLAEISSTA